jgi:hypothetical protein
MFIYILQRVKGPASVGYAYKKLVTINSSQHYLVVVLNTIGSNAHQEQKWRNCKSSIITIFINGQDLSPSPDVHSSGPRSWVILP